jgi:hypothetical protein
MAIQHVNTTSFTDTQGTFANKYNATCDEIFVSGTISGRNIVFTKSGGGTQSVSNVQFWGNNTTGGISDALYYKDVNNLNICDAQQACVIGGTDNQARALIATVAGGLSNRALAILSNIFGGGSNRVVLGADSSSIIGGLSCSAQTGIGSIILGGSGNTTNASYASVLAGQAINANINNTAFAQNLALTNGKFYIQTGTSRTAGVATLTAGQVTVSNTLVTTSSIIQLTHQITGGTVGVLSVGTRVNNTSFVINSSSATDTSTIGYFIIQPF